MDIDADVILNGVPDRDVGLQIFEELIAVAGGKKTKSEAQGLGEEEFVPLLFTTRPASTAALRSSTR